MTKAELEYLTRMPNEVRRLADSINNLAEVLKPISEACKGGNVEAETILDPLRNIGKEILNHHKVV